MPKVFISYSYDSDEHQRWVYELAAKLRNNGVDVIFDKFETRLGSDLSLFMEQGLNKSTRVICVCSDNYNKKPTLEVMGLGMKKELYHQI